MSDLDKWRSIGAPRKTGQAEYRVEKTEDTTLITTEHWDGRRDATIRPATIRHGARVHSTGKKKGAVAEISEMSVKERKVRYGE